ncbi:MAG TPA: hypothetical protein VKN36_15810 [Eudoraea sp.]|nr:hypothetical protein [Eudoraea sp.]
MLLKRTNIEVQLSRVRDHQTSEKMLLDNVYAFLREDADKEERIKKTISGDRKKKQNAFNTDLLEISNIYHLEHIRKICIVYRLRFLDTRYFKGEIPQEAISRIKKLERNHKTELQGYKIIAPSRLFKLKDKDDPLLFVPIGNDYFYLIHKWGNDLHPLRKLLVWPFRNIVNLTLLVVLISYLVTLLIPDGLFSKTNSTAEFWIIFFFMFKCIASVVIFYGFALGKNFNPAIWRSRFFN